MFDQAELSQLIGGENASIDMDDLRQHTVVSGYMNDKTIQAFWKVVKAFSHEEKKALIKFVTSCARPPLYVSLIPTRRFQPASQDRTLIPRPPCLISLCPGSLAVRVP